VLNRRLVAAVVLTFALSLSFTQEASARHFGHHGRGGGGAAIAALAIGSLASSGHYGRGYYGRGSYGRGYSPYSYGYAPSYSYAPAYNTYDPYYSPYAAAPVAYAPYGYATPVAYSPYGGGYPYGYGYRRHRSSVLPALSGAGIAYAILRHR
jgi:hypothetical protein